ncbi:nuclear transport factor 2 family protein [Sphingomonas glaciei]|uniref:Nuclear transport factor 2 family protein n=1 Tax=Sphingomonas glaciei TaxID=2938948 RepID=A0ABY5MWD4_9SPHN|nr:nuclear transport factor 2 family protein [Sphingomonas glaciei]UUR08301.1 nuclear transport factor 2 family protein [Sphingomonas glaciei]
MASGSTQPLADPHRAEIERQCARLVHVYANANDAADWDKVAALYAEDGVMFRPTAAADGVAGRDRILASLRARPPRTTRHVCANVVVDVLSETEATGESAMLLFIGSAKPLVGSFHDRFVLTDEGWRFAERRGSLTFGA